MKKLSPRRVARFSVIPILLFAAVAVVAIMGAKEADPAKTGVKVGEQAPDFTLTGADGQTYTLSEMIKNGPVALVFTRSADW